MNAKVIEMNENKPWNIDQLFGIRNALVEMNKKTGHGLGYEINKNLSVINNALQDWEKRLNEFKGQNYEKDLAGNDLLFVANSVDGNLSEIDGKICVVCNEKDCPDGFNSIAQKDVEPHQKTVKRFEPKDVESVQKGLDKFGKETFKIVLDVFPVEDLKTAFKEKTLDGIDLTPLFGSLIF